MRASALMAILIAIDGLAGCQGDRGVDPATESGSPRLHTNSGAASSIKGAPVSDDETMNVEQTFRQHYDSHYANTGYGYNQYRPAYRYGFDLASDPRYQEMDWTTMERIALRGWDNSKMGEWEQYKDAVRYGWEVKRTKRNKG